MSSLLAELREIRRVAALGEALDIVQLQGVLDRIPQEAPGLPQASLRDLQVEIDALMSFAEEQRDGVAEQLEQLHKGRAAIQGYNHLQAFHTAQRLSKRA